MTLFKKIKPQRKSRLFLDMSVKRLLIDKCNYDMQWRHLITMDDLHSIAYEAGFDVEFNLKERK